MHALLLLVSLSVVAQPPAGGEPLALIRRAIQAHGGPDSLDRLHLIREKSDGTLSVLGQKTPFTSETVQRLPGQFRHTLSADLSDKKLDIVEVFDGKQGWRVEGGLAKPVDAPTLEGWKATAHAAHVASLTALLAADKGYKLTALPETKVGGKPALGVKVSCPQQRDVTLWFDRATGLLVKRDLRPHAGSADSVQEEIYSDFKEVQGLKRFTRVRILINGAEHADVTVRSTELLDRLDDKEFAKP